MLASVRFHDKPQLHRLATNTGYLPYCGEDAARKSFFYANGLKKGCISSFALLYVPSVEVWRQVILEDMRP
jgi:hypothetical protein